MHILFWTYKTRVTKTGEVPVIMRITINGQRVSFTTNIFIQPKLWDNAKQKVKGNSDLVKEYNNKILYFTSAAWNHYNDAFRKDKAISPETIRDLLLNKSRPIHTLMEVISYHIENLTKRVELDISVNTVKKYKTIERKIKVFLQKKYSRSDINLSDLSHKFIVEFDLYMKTEGLKHNAAIKNLQQLKSVIRVCVQNGWLEKDPFTNYKLSLKDTERGYLTAAELKVMEEVLLPSERLEHVRDIFIFCCYTGLAYADVSKLNSSHIEKGQDGIVWIKLNRTKSKSRSVIPLLPRAREILDKYSHYAKTNPEKKLLPVISN